jgi:hypothetical protein
MTVPEMPIEDPMFKFPNEVNLTSGLEYQTLKPRHITQNLYERSGNNLTIRRIHTTVQVARILFQKDKPFEI